jgi:hypothetical protein
LRQGLSSTAATLWRARPSSKPPAWAAPRAHGQRVGDCPLQLAAVAVAVGKLVGASARRWGGLGACRLPLPALLRWGGVEEAVVAAAAPALACLMYACPSVTSTPAPCPS